MQHSDTYELMTKRSLHIDYGRCQYIITFKSDSAEVKIRPDFAKNTFQIIICYSNFPAREYGTRYLDDMYTIRGIRL